MVLGSFFVSLIYYVLLLFLVLLTKNGARNGTRSRCPTGILLYFFHFAIYLYFMLLCSFTICMGLMWVLTHSYFLSHYIYYVLLLSMALKNKNGARNGTRTHTALFATGPSNLRVCQFHHPRTYHN